MTNGVRLARVRRRPGALGLLRLQQSMQQHSQPDEATVLWLELETQIDGNSCLTERRGFRRNEHAAASEIPNKVRSGRRLANPKSLENLKLLAQRTACISAASEKSVPTSSFKMGASLHFGSHFCVNVWGTCEHGARVCSEKCIV